MTGRLSLLKEQITNLGAGRSLQKSLDQDSLDHDFSRMTSALDKVEELKRKLRKPKGRRMEQITEKRTPSSHFTRSNIVTPDSTVKTGDPTLGLSSHH